jgi:hypothetical protein
MLILPLTCLALMTAGAGAQSIAAPPVVLTGIVELPASNSAGFKRAFFELGFRDSTLSCSLAEGQRSGDVEVLKIDSKNGSVTIRYQGQNLDLSFTAQAHRQRAELIAEQRKDLSHTEYHTTRAKLDRERDAAQRATKAR